MDFETEKTESTKATDVAKLQEWGKDKKGSPRYILYVTAAAKALSLTKGDLIEFSIKKIGHREVCNTNPNVSENFKKIKTNSFKELSNIQ